MMVISVMMTPPESVLAVRLAAGLVPVAGVGVSWVRPAVAASSAYRAAYRLGFARSRGDETWVHPDSTLAWGGWLPWRAGQGLPGAPPPPFLLLDEVEDLDGLGVQVECTVGVAPWWWAVTISVYGVMTSTTSSGCHFQPCSFQSR